MSKVYSTWIPHLLTPLQRHEWVEASEELLARYEEEEEGNDLLSRIITVDEWWFYYYQPEWKQWKRADSPPPTKFKQEKSERKVLYSFFWDYNDVILKEPVPAGRTIPKTYYANLLINKLHLEIKKRRWASISTGAILHRDNALAHTSSNVLSPIDNLRYELLRHPPYSPDLAANDSYLFPLLKEYLKARRYEDVSALPSSIDQCLNGLSEDDFTAAIQQLPERWRKCISVNGRYSEKEFKCSVFPSFEIKSVRQLFQRTIYLSVPTSYRIKNIFLLSLEENQWCQKFFNNKRRMSKNYLNSDPTEWLKCSVFD